MREFDISKAWVILAAATESDDSPGNSILRDDGQTRTPFSGIIRFSAINLDFVE